MSYYLKEVTIRSDNTLEGLKKIEELWKAVMDGSLPILCDSEHQMRQGILPVACYSNYASDETGAYDLGIMAVDPSFFQTMEELVAAKQYRKYEAIDEDIDVCTKKVWEMVWQDSKNQRIQRTFTKDYEISMPIAFSEDGKAHCTLFISIRS
ncbi:hypothetical protein [[Eubacterium] hominis]|uniref:hypothetical protein n=1 Tax=[Eubacterium] hominis TaxID=2764325 RepID=UPI003A4D6C19